MINLPDRNLTVTNEHIRVIVEKLKRTVVIYEEHMETVQMSLNCMLTETSDHYTSPPSYAGTSIREGTEWGGEYRYGWFQTSFTIPENLSGHRLYLKQDTEAVECLIFLNGKPMGEFDNCKDYSSDSRLHKRFLLTECAQKDLVFNVALEAYSGHLYTGMHFGEAVETDPKTKIRKFQGIHIVTVNETIRRFRYDLMTLLSLYDALDAGDPFYARIVDVLIRVYSAITQTPSERSAHLIEDSLKTCIEWMAEPLSCKNGDAVFEAGLIGHSHMDTVWLWPFEETRRKLARTFSNALRLMEQYPEYTFIASSALHYEMIRCDYPYIFEDIKTRVAQGRWEPNGATWIEMDCNLAGGEACIRQFLKGQAFFAKHFGKICDTFWLPDTFGYSAAIPQIMEGCGVRYFCTTKLYWNDTNQFPYDSFYWEGIDGTRVLTHFHKIHFLPEPNEIKNQAQNNILLKHHCAIKLFPYGYGDGGGGPSEQSVEMAMRIRNLQGIPRAEHTTVSSFMNRLENQAKGLPTYVGELYLELHRGTLTTFHDIKKLNRSNELLLRDLEIAGLLAGLNPDNLYFSASDKIYTDFLRYQFHDSLPGTCISRVMDETIEGLVKIEEESSKQLSSLLPQKTSNRITLMNTLSWMRKSGFLEGEFALECVSCQHYEDLDGNMRTYCSDIMIPPLSMQSFVYEKKSLTPKKSAFHFDGTLLETPYAKIVFQENGYIASFYDKEAKRNICDQSDGALPLGAFILMEDVPLLWDNWDIDYDVRLKKQLIHTLAEREIIADGDLFFVIRSRFKISDKSDILKDMIVYADRPDVEFDVVVNWNETHCLLKTCFDMSVHSSYIRNECQFGYVERSMARLNSSLESAKHEICQHKWSDLSETRYGVTLMNNCKYGVGAENGSISLTLIKSGTHPDPRADRGRHRMLYALRPHACGFTAEEVVHPAYELNIPLRAFTESDYSCQSFLTVDAPNILCETLKASENRKGFIIRLYECEKSQTNTAIHFSAAVKSIFETNMLEEPCEKLTMADNSLALSFRPFEIKTIYVEFN